MTLPLSLIVAHFVGDFMLQSDDMALRKSKEWRVLALHVLIYAVLIYVALVLVGLGADPFWRVKFGVVTFVTHFLTDAVTSRWTSKLWFLPKVGEGMKPNWIQVEVRPTRHWFFCVIGLDQLIHYATLAATYAWLR